MGVRGGGGHGEASRSNAIWLKPGGASPAYKSEKRISWIWSSHWACSGFIRTERREVTVGLSRRAVVGRFWKKAAGSSARARGRFLAAAASKMWRDSAEISVSDADSCFGRGTSLTYRTRFILTEMVAFRTQESVNGG